MNVGDRCWFAWYSAGGKPVILEAVFQGTEMDRFNGERMERLLLPSGDVGSYYAWRVRATREEAELDQAFCVFGGRLHL